MAFEISRASADEWAQVVEWAAAEGWNPGHGDRSLFHAQDPEGFFIGRLDGRPVSAISVVNYDEDYAFLGFYLVVPEQRGKGFGLATWKAGLEHAGSRTVGLDGVVAQQGNYRASGFAFAHRTLRYSGVPSRPETTADSDLELVRIAGVEGAQAAAAYDRQCYPADRAGFVIGWATAPGHVAFAARRGGRVTGYGVVRPALDARRIGPLFADDARSAEALFDGLLAAVGGQVPVSLDVPEPNGPGLALAVSRGLEAVFETARMYTGPIRELRAGKVFAVTSLELG